MGVGDALVNSPLREHAENIEGITVIIVRQQHRKTKEEKEEHEGSGGETCQEQRQWSTLFGEYSAGRDRPGVLRGEPRLQPGFQE